VASPPTQPSQLDPPYWRAVGALSLAHGANDMYMGFLPALLPLIVTRLGLTLVQAGLLATVVSVTSQLTQPLFGYAADRVGRRGLAVGGPLLTALSMCWVGLLPSYELVLVALILASVGTAAFHPQGAAITGSIARRRSASAMAIFTAGGNIGFGIGPVLVIAVVNLFGIGRTWLTLPVGIAAGLLVITSLPSSLGRRTKSASEPPDENDRVPTGGAVHSRRRSEDAVAMVGNAKRYLAPLAVLFSVVLLRAATATLFTTFVPVLTERRGQALMLGGFALLGFSLAGAAGGLVGGRVSERIGRKWVTVGSLALASPALFAFLHTGGLVAAGMLLVTGVCVFSALPVNIVMGQELVPSHAGTVSGLVMGCAWGVGGISTTALGALADRFTVSMGPVAGLALAMDYVALLPLLGAVMALALPETLRAQRPEAERE
jgi:FSR family fosmidomycin resistance protein-like MFS transporter